MHGLIFETSIWLLAGSTRLDWPNVQQQPNKSSVVMNYTGSEQNVENHILKLRNQTIASLPSLSWVSDAYISTNTQYLEKFA